MSLINLWEFCSFCESLSREKSKNARSRNLFIKTFFLVFVIFFLVNRNKDSSLIQNLIQSIKIAFFFTKKHFRIIPLPIQNFILGGRPNRHRNVLFISCQDKLTPALKMYMWWWCVLEKEHWTGNGNLLIVSSFVLLRIHYKVSVCCASLGALLCFLKVQNKVVMICPVSTNPDIYRFFNKKDFLKHPVKSSILVITSHYHSHRKYRKTW